MNQEKKPPNLREDLLILYPNLDKNELGILQNYVKKEGFGNIIHDFVMDPKKKYLESKLKELKMVIFRKFRVLGMADYFPVKLEEGGKGMQDYFWISTPQYINLRPLKTLPSAEDRKHIDPLKVLNDKLRMDLISDQVRKSRMMIVKQMITGLGDLNLTDKQMKGLEDLALATYQLAQRGTDTDHYPIQANYIRTFFIAGLDILGIYTEKNEETTEKVNTGEEKTVYRPKLVYSPIEPIEPLTRESVERKFKKIQEDIDMRSGEFPPLRHYKPPVAIPVVSSTKEEEVKEKPSKVKKKVKKPTKKRKKKVKKGKSEETLADQVLRTMLPGLLEES